MTKTLAIVLLGVVLVGSNVWWAMRAIDTGLAMTYREVSFDAHRKALKQTITLLPVVARCGASRVEVMAAAALPNEPFVSFEKDGFVWIGRIGLKFDDDHRLVEVAGGWDPP